MSCFERKKLAATIVALLSLLAVCATARCSPTLPTPEYVGTTFENFQNAADWLVANGSALNETAHARLLPTSMRLTSNAGMQARADKLVHVDLSKALTFSFWVYQANADLDWTDGGIEFWTDANGAKRLIASWSMHPGWNKIVLSKGDFTTTNGASWADAVVRVRLVLFPLTGRSMVCNFDDLAYSAYHLATVILAFDDGYPGQYTEALPYMRDYGFRGTLYLTHAQVRTGGLTEAQIGEMYNAGWDVCNHSYTHSDPLKSASYALAMQEYGGMSDYLVSKGWTRNNCHLHVAYPWGKYNDDTMKAMKDLGMLTGRIAFGRIQANMLDERYLLPAYMVAGSASPWLAKIDRVASTGGSILLVFHGISSASGDLSPDVFKAIVDHIAVLRSYGMVQVQTVSEWYTGL